MAEDKYVSIGKWSISIDGAGISNADKIGFYSVSGPSLSIGLEWHMAAGRQGISSTSVATPGHTTYSTLTLTYPLSKESKSLYDWRKKIIDGKFSDALAAEITVTFYDDDGQQALMAYHYHYCWPCGYYFDGAHTDTSSPATETMTLVFERFERENLG